MVLKVSINKTELLILPVSTQLGSVSLSHSGLFSFLCTPYIIHLLFRTTKGNGRLSNCHKSNVWASSGLAAEALLPAATSICHWTSAKPSLPGLPNFVFDLLQSILTKPDFLFKIC